jgi:hypothetical protein
VDHYSKWVEARLVVEHGVAIIAEFFLKQNYMQIWCSQVCFIDNASKWVEDFLDLYKNYVIQHQHISLAHFKCNGMAKWLIKNY